MMQMVVKANKKKLAITTLADKMIVGIFVFLAHNNKV
ncbi:hypothetical protein GNIT_0179 [Glaciecola nitratireducens FR1064]|uniref:Uncharacterized protein n=1 Tax=Glaciecola nitratireducens (strain JCM 12485 / KCTC 12276 / FR1064) TaxID=1085623 RepID=G4QIZ4_GLANF|nr:hypothetical protein GNIT_0179 [Glaciecola nitratireducens FR1064]